MLGAGLWAAAMSLVVVLALGLATVAEASIAVADAESAADAAALAGAAAGGPAARELARRNGATVVAVEWHGPIFVVTVRVNDALATAAAERVETPIRPG